MGFPAVVECSASGAALQQVAFEPRLRTSEGRTHVVEAEPGTSTAAAPAGPALVELATGFCTTGLRMVQHDGRYAAEASNTHAEALVAGSGYWVCPSRYP